MDLPSPSSGCPSGAPSRPAAVRIMARHAGGGLGLGTAALRYDPRCWNPVGWVRNVEYRPLSLGPRRLLPAGTKAVHQAEPRDRRALRYCHHVEDVAAFHADAMRRAATLVRLAALGTPVCLADGGPGLKGLLGRELHDLMASASVRGANAFERERLSVRMRRIALRDFARRGAGGRPGTGPAGRADGLPTVSILLATRRPAFLERALANVARQDYPRLELVLALHGDGFDAPSLKEFPLPVRIVLGGADTVLGALLDQAAAVAEGTLVTKMDDDDLYGAAHVWDLVLAREYSGAELIAKGVETAYLAGRDVTVRYGLGNSETFASRHLSGAAMLISRQDLRDLGGWPAVRGGEDMALVHRVIRAGGRTYRTHGAGIVVVRHGQRHAWHSRDEDFLAQAQAVHRGFRPDLADLEAWC